MAIGPELGSEQVSIDTYLVGWELGLEQVSLEKDSVGWFTINYSFMTAGQTQGCPTVSALRALYIGRRCLLIYCLCLFVFVFEFVFLAASQNTHVGGCKP